MRILVHSLTFPPDNISTGKLVSEIANGLSSFGHDIVALVSTPQYNPDIDAEGGQPLIKISRNMYQSKFKDIDVYHIQSNVRSHKKIRRAFQWIKYHVASINFLIRKRKSFDKVLIFSYPPTMNIVVIFCSLFLKKSVVYSLWELYPEVALNLAEVTKGIVSKPFKMIDNYSLKRAQVVVNSNELKSYLINERNISDKNIDVIYHFSPDNNPRLNLDLLDNLNKTIAYAGNFGKPQDLISFVNTFNKVNDGTWNLILIGSGAQYDEVKSLESEYINVYSYLSKDALNEKLQEVQIMLVSLSDKLTVEGFPGKTFDYLSRGKYILCYANPRSAVANLITNNNLGTNIKPGDHLALADMLKKINIEEIKSISRNALDVTDNLFSKDTVILKYNEVIK